MKNFHSITYLAAMAMVTIFSALIYATVQQSYRTTANDPQIQIASDMVNRINENKPIDQFMIGDTIELSNSLSVFKILFDKEKKPIRSTAFLNGKLPVLPQGVFDFALRNNENVFTWQPRNDVRAAMVLKSIRSADIAFVAVGRSLKEVEKRESNLRTMVFIAWIFSLSVILFHWLAILLFTKKETGLK